MNFLRPSIGTHCYRKKLDLRSNQPFLPREMTLAILILNLLVKLLGIRPVYLQAQMLTSYLKGIY